MDWWNDFWTELTGPITLDGTSAFFVKLAQVALVIILALLARAAAGVFIRRTVERIVSGAKKKRSVDDTQELAISPMTVVRTVQRTRTLGALFTNVVNVVIGVLVFIIVVDILWPGILGTLALLTAAVGAGLGFGAQNVVRDALNGVFLVFEDQLGVGDIVELGSANVTAVGMVESVTMRVTRLRDVNGTVWYVRNGEIAKVGNMSQGWARVMVDVSLPHSTNIPKIEAAMLAAAVEMATVSEWRSRIVESPELWGVEAATEDAVVTRLVVKARAGSRDDVAAELRRRVVDVLRSEGIKQPVIAAPHPNGFESATRVKGSRPPRPRAPRTPTGSMKAVTGSTKTQTGSTSTGSQSKPSK